MYENATCENYVDFWRRRAAGSYYGEYDRLTSAMLAALKDMSLLKWQRNRDFNAYKPQRDDLNTRTRMLLSTVLSKEQAQACGLHVDE